MKQRIRMINIKQQLSNITPVHTFTVYISHLCPYKHVVEENTHNYNCRKPDSIG